MKRALVLAACLAGAGCHFVDHAIADKVARDQEKVRTYDGVYVERGTVPGEPGTEVRSRVRFMAPSTFVLEVLSPEEYAGETVAYLDSELWLYSAKHDVGVHVRGVPWSEARWRDWIYETVRLDRERYDFEQADQPDTVAGRVALPFTVTAKEATPLDPAPARTWMDEEFSLPLRVEAPLDGGARYSFRFEQVAFNRPMERPDFEPPPGSSWLEWDMAASAMTIDEVKHYADFELLEPQAPPLGLERTKIVWAATDVVPLFTMVYESGPFYASIAECRDQSYRDPRARGLRLALGGRDYRLAAVGSMSFVDFVEKGVLVTIVSNLPPVELLALAQSLGR